jgi:hypothetical protein
LIYLIDLVFFVISDILKELCFDLVGKHADLNVSGGKLVNIRESLFL